MNFVKVAIAVGFGARAFLNFFLHLGALGVLLLAALDSSFLFLPFGNDLLLIALISNNPGAGNVIWCVILAAVGSCLGVLFVDLIMRKAGEQGLERFVNARRIKKLKKQMDKHAGVAIFVSSLVPPPFPFTAVIMTASALQYSRKKLLLTVFAGRALRFAVEGMLAVYLGRKVLVIMDSKAMSYFVYSLIGIAIVGSAFSLVKWLRRGDKSRIDNSVATES